MGDPNSFLAAADRLGYKLMGGFARMFGGLASKDEETYWQAVLSGTGDGFVDLAATIGDEETASVKISQEADFVATRFLTESVNPSTGVVLADPSWTVLVTDGGSDRQLSPTPLHRTTIAGTAQRSVPFTKNRLFKRNSQVKFTFRNLTAVATRIFFAVQGYKIFDEEALDLVRRR